ncbi:MAG: hypothetical protein EPN46_02485 [Candidimonas sp.]|nr:MAG: hypothetical protein EPN62_12335 [Candidimonas sp.]TAM80200.1 MAG: hypothetical protein EPN46_02485 [Candidimonas sp.]
MAARRWTPDQRRTQAEKIRQWQPWAHSTGAKTPKGKAASSRNAYKGGAWRELRQAVKDLNAAMREQAALLDRL